MNLDAYMIRKIAPRLFFAVIGINLSIYLCVGAIDITTVAGHGIGQLIRGPFDAAGVLNAQPDAGGSNIGGGALLVLGALFGVPAFAGGQALSTMFFLLLPVFVLILTTLLTVALRQALLVLLTMVAPAAIVLSVLPGTEKYFKQWWDLFLKTLMVYPMIAAIFAVSDVLTAINYNNSHAGNDPNAAVQVINGLIFAFLPLALIPFVFRFAGGALGAFSNASRQAQSMANRLSGQRLQGNYSQGLEHVRASGLIGNYDRDPETGAGRGLRHRINRGAAKIANLNQMRLTRPRQSLNDAVDRATAQAATEQVGKSPEAMALDGFDDEHKANALSNGTAADIDRKLIQVAGQRFNDQAPDLSSAERAERRKNRIGARNRIMDLNKVRGADAGRAFSAMTLPSISTAFDEQVYKYKTNSSGGLIPDGRGGYALSDEIWQDGDGDHLKSDTVAKSSHDQMQEMIHKVSGGRRGLGNAILVKGIQGAKQAGRFDLAASASANLLYQEALRSGDKNAIEDSKKRYEEMIRERITPGQAAQGHPRAAREVARAWKNEINALMGAGATADKSQWDPKKDSVQQMENNKKLIRLLADTAGFQEVLGSAGSEAVDAFQDNMLGYKPEGANVTIGQMMEHARKTADFAERRREWGTEAEGHEASERAAQIAKMQEEAQKAQQSGQGQ